MGCSRRVGFGGRSCDKQGAHQGPVSKWSLRQDLLLKLRNLELESLTCLSLSSKSCLKLHLETGPRSCMR